MCGRGLLRLGIATGANPGSHMLITIDMWDVAWKFQKGSRIRIDITSSDFPQYAVHSNYAGCWALAAESRDAHQKIHYGKGHISSVVFPKLG